MNIIDSFLPYLDYNLVSNKAFTCISTLSKILPAYSVAVLECRLSENQPRVDLEINLLREPFIDLPIKLFNYPEWQSLNDIYQEWIKTDSSLSEQIEHIWLEFDIEEQPQFIPIPCFFFLLNQKKFHDKTLIEISSILLNRNLSSSFKSNLKYCVDCLPDKSILAYLGAMLSRSEETIRIVSRIPSEQILDYLIKIGWSGSKEVIKSLLLEISTFTDYVGLSYDVGETVMPRIGIECYLLKQPKYESKWQKFLDYLVNSNLCSFAKSNALLAWSGYYQKTWHNYFTSFSKSNIFRRRISHLKIVCDSQNCLEAKAYLELCEISGLLSNPSKLNNKVAQI